VSSSVLVEECSGVVVEIEDGATTLVQSDDTASTLIVEEVELLVDQAPQSQLVEYDDEATVLEIQYVLPTQTTPEEEEVYATRVDFDDDNNLLYKGQAAPGSSESSPVWRISKISFVGSDEDVVEEWAGGSASFDKVWDNRLGLSYS
jgi:hypothetical protein